MKREILDHAGLILSRESTRTLSARALHERITAALGAEFGYAHLLETLGSRPDRFTIVTDGATFGDCWAVPDAERVTTLLENAGVLRSATVVLADRPVPDEQRTAAPDEVATALAATLADAHAAVVELLLLEQDASATPLGSRTAVLALDELRSACAAQLRDPRRT